MSEEQKYDNKKYFM